MGYGRTEAGCPSELETAAAVIMGELALQLTQRGHEINGLAWSGD